MRFDKLTTAFQQALADAQTSTVRQRFRNFFPSVFASGTYGAARSDMNEIYSYGLQLTWTMFDGGNLTAPLTDEVFLSARNRIVAASPNLNRLVTRLSTPAGLLRGSFRNPETGKTCFIKGVVLQNRNAGGGFFTGTNQSGAFFLGLPEDFPLFEP